jgi:hypothetical protein
MEDRVTLKRIVIGTLGLWMTLVWSLALVYQRHNVELFVILALLKRSGIDDTGGLGDPLLTTDGAKMPNKALQPTRRDPHLTALPSSPVASAERRTLERQRPQRHPRGHAQAPTS